jgi:hypothetical protein
MTVGNRWRERSARLIAHDIKSKHGGEWPAEIDDWAKYAARYGLALYVLDLDLSFLAQTLDNVIVVRYVSNPAVLARRICHEIAEALTRRECGIPPCLFHSPHDEHHRVARHAERQMLKGIKREEGRGKREEKTCLQ